MARIGKIFFFIFEIIYFSLKKLFVKYINGFFSFFLMRQKKYSICDADLYQKQWYAECYGLENKGYWSSLCKDLVASLDLDPESRVIDLGCGTGYLTQELLPKVKHVYAIDPSIAMLRVLRKHIRANNLDIFHGTIEDFVCSSPPIPLILAHGVFVTLKKPFRTLSSIYSYLPHKGIFTFSVENWENQNIDGEPYEKFLQRQEKLTTELELPNLQILLTAESRYTKEDVSLLIQSAGGHLLDCSERTMSTSAEDLFDSYELQGELQHLCSIQKEDHSLFKRDLALKREGIQRKIDAWKQLEALFTGKIWTIGTQYICHTEALKE